MGVSTKGFVLTNCKNVFFVSHAVSRALNRLIRSRSGIRGFAFTQEQREQWSWVKMELSDLSDCVSFRFTFDGQHRTLRLNFDCDCDNVEYGPASLSMSLGCNGEAELLVRTALRACSMLGPTYFDANDCDDIDSALIEQAPLNFIQACVEGVASATEGAIGEWLAVYDSLDPVTRVPLPEFLGLDEQELLAVVSLQQDKPKDYWTTVGAIIDARIERVQSA